MKASWMVLAMAIAMGIIGVILSEVTVLGLSHPLIGDSVIMVTLWYIIRTEEIYRR